eukprot:1383922-Alexandrium_andersonii.AAC.1
MRDAERSPSTLGRPFFAFFVCGLDCHRGAAELPSVRAVDQCRLAGAGRHRWLRPKETCLLYTSPSPRD